MGRGGERSKGNSDKETKLCRGVDRDSSDSAMHPGVLGQPQQMEEARNGFIWRLWREAGPARIGT